MIKAVLFALTFEAPHNAIGFLSRFASDTLDKYEIKMFDEYCKDQHNLERMKEKNMDTLSDFYEKLALLVSEAQDSDFSNDEIIRELMREIRQLQ